VLFGAASKRRFVIPIARVGIAAWALVLLAAIASLAAVSPSRAQTPEVAIVASVFDGDTLRLRDGREVRLLQIDAPELGKCYSLAARAALLRLTPPKSAVALQSDPALDETDRFGRLLRYVSRFGVNVNLELVRRGAAAPYFQRGERGMYADALMQAARRAKSAKRGLWRACPATRLDPRHAIKTRRKAPPGRERSKAAPKH
jgi:micrococcal nuclease